MCALGSDDRGHAQVQHSQWGQESEGDTGLIDEAGSTREEAAFAVGLLLWGSKRQQLQ